MSGQGPRSSEQSRRFEGQSETGADDATVLLLEKLSS